MITVVRLQGLHSTGVGIGSHVVPPGPIVGPRGTNIGDVQEMVHIGCSLCIIMNIISSGRDRGSHRQMIRAHPRPCGKLRKVLGEILTRQNHQFWRNYLSSRNSF